MSTPEDPNRPEDAGGHSGHRWMMIACCIPMLAIAVGIAVAGGGFGALPIAIACTVMMAMMMGGMSHDDGGDRS